VGNSCFVGNIPPNISSDEIEELFARAAPAPIRPIARIHKDGRYAFVTLANFVAAKQAADQLHGSLLYGRNIRVEVTQNVPRYVIQQALTHHHIQQHTQQHRAPVPHITAALPPSSTGGAIPHSTSLSGRVVAAISSDSADGEQRSSSVPRESVGGDPAEPSSSRPWWTWMKHYSSFLWPKSDDEMRKWEAVRTRGAECRQHLHVMVVSWLSPFWLPTRGRSSSDKNKRTARHVQSFATIPFFFWGERHIGDLRIEYEGSRDQDDENGVFTTKKKGGTWSNKHNAQHKNKTKHKNGNSQNQQTES
jgi:hypothetical protein